MHSWADDHVPPKPSDPDPTRCFESACHLGFPLHLVETEMIYDLLQQQGL